MLAPIGKVVLNFIRACEFIHGRLAHGEPLTSEERDLIESSSTELLSKLRSA